MKDQQQLFNLAGDPGEKVNLTAKHPEQVKALNTAFDKWIEHMADPITGGSKRWGNRQKEPLTGRQKERLRKRSKRKRQRKTEKKTKKQSASPKGPIE